MPTPDLLLLRLARAEASGALDTPLPEREPAFTSRTSAALAFEGGLNVGPWTTGADGFVPTRTGHRAGITSTVDGDDSVRHVHVRGRRDPSSRRRHRGRSSS